MNGQKILDMKVEEILPERLCSIFFVKRHTRIPVNINTIGELVSYNPSELKLLHGKMVYSLTDSDIAEIQTSINKLGLSLKEEEEIKFLPQMSAYLDTPFNVMFNPINNSFTENFNKKYYTLKFLYKEKDGKNIPVNTIRELFDNDIEELIFHHNDNTYTSPNLIKEFLSVFVKDNCK